MSNQLQENLDAILLDKNTNLLPENLKAGVTCLGVEGTLEGETPVVKTVTCPEIDAANSDKKNSTTVNGYSALMFVGGSNNWDYRAYLKHDLTELQTIPNIEIVSAKLHFTIALGNDYYRDGSGYVFKCTSDWSSDTLNWNNQPELKSYIDDVETPSYSPDVDVPYTYSLDITSIVKSWIDNKYPNYGICFKGTEGGGYRLDHRIASAKYDNGQYASYIKVQYKTTVSDITLQEKSVDIIDNGTTEVVPDSDYYGLSKVNINTNVPTGIDTSDADALAGDIREGKTAYVNGEKVTGTIKVLNDYGLDSEAETITSMPGFPIGSETKLWFNGYKKVNMGANRLYKAISPRIYAPYSQVAEAIGLTSNKLVEGNTILNVEGTAVELKGQTKSVTPTTDLQTITPDENYNGLTSVEVSAVTSDIDENIKAENIKSGVEILGVTGTLESGTGIDTSDATAVASDILNGKTAYVNGEKITGTLPLFPNTRTFTVSNAGVTNNTEDSTLDLTTINTTKQILDSNVSMNFNADYSDVATAIGLTADKIKAEETILGITGTYEGSGSSSDFNQYGNMMVYNEGWSEYYFLTKNTYLRQVRCTDAVKADGGQAVCNLSQVDIVVSNNSAYVSGLFNSTDVINSQTLYLKLMNNDTVIYSTPIEVPEISNDNTYKDIILSDIKISTGIMESTEDINNRLLTCTNAIFTSVQ